MFLRAIVNKFITFKTANYLHNKDQNANTVISKITCGVVITKREYLNTEYYFFHFIAQKTI